MSTMAKKSGRSKNEDNNVTDEDDDLHRCRRFECLRSAMNLALSKARDEIDLERAIALGYGGGGGGSSPFAAGGGGSASTSTTSTHDDNTAIYQKVLQGILESAHVEIGKRTERSFDELAIEDKLLRFELAIVQERVDRAAEQRQKKQQRDEAQAAIQSARSISGVDPNGLLRRRQYQELLATQKSLAAQVELETAAVTKLEQELVNRTVAVETRLTAIIDQVAKVSRAADLCGVGPV
jgi:hypothetical protein